MLTATLPLTDTPTPSLTQQYRNLAEEVAALYADLRGVEAVWLRGSVAEGCATDFSDIDLAVFWNERPGPEEWNHIHEMHKARRPRFQHTKENLMLCAHGELVEAFDYDEVGFDVVHFAVPEWIDFLKAMTNPAHMSAEGYGWLWSLKDAVSLYDASLSGLTLLDISRTFAFPYPDALREPLVLHWLRKGGQPGTLSEALERPGQVLKFYADLVRRAEVLTGVLCAVNREYYPGRLDRVGSVIAALEHKPPDFRERMEAAMQKPITEAIEAITRLTDETMAILRQQMPDFDWSKAQPYGWPLISPSAACVPADARAPPMH